MNDEKPVRSYGDVLAEISSFSQCNLLLGNGFSCAFDSVFSSVHEDSWPDSENDETLLSRIKKESAQIYDGCDVAVVEDGIEVRPTKSMNEILFRQVADVHPIGLCKMELSKAISCSKFLKPYLEKGKVFTLNYDLLPYWAVVKIADLSEADRNKNSLLNVPDFNEGFTEFTNGRWVWRQGGKQNVFYCHGALNFEYNSDANETYKRRTDQLCFQPIKNRFDSGDIPLFVSKSTSQAKQKMIRENDYLRNCLEMLKAVEDVVVVFGVGFPDNDDHIMDALKEARLKNHIRVYYGVYGNPSWGAPLVEKKFKACGFEPDKDFFIFDSKCAKVWESED